MKVNQNIKFREAERILLTNGFVYDKCKGSHYQYLRNGYRVVIPLKLNPVIWHEICKKHNLLHKIER